MSLIEEIMKEMSIKNKVYRHMIRMILITG